MLTLRLNFFATLAVLVAVMMAGSVSASDRFSTEADTRQHRNIDTLVNDRVAPVMPTTLQATGGTATAGVTSATDQAENASQAVNKTAEQVEAQMNAEVAGLNQEIDSLRSEVAQNVFKKQVTYGYTAGSTYTGCGTNGKSFCSQDRSYWVRGYSCTKYLLDGKVFSKVDKLDISRGGSTDPRKLPYKYRQPFSC